MPRLRNKSTSVVVRVGDAVAASLSRSEWAEVPAPKPAPVKK